jgi:hypothetical protein
LEKWEVWEGMRELGKGNNGWFWERGKLFVKKVWGERGKAIRNVCGTDTAGERRRGDFEEES